MPLPPRRRSMLSLISLIVIILTCTTSGAAAILDDYVAAPDPSYAWSMTRQSPLTGGTTLYQLNLTSQTWHGTLWQHRLYIVMPSGIPQHKTALLYISGSGAGLEELAFMSTLAQKLSAPIATLFDVPNQPLFSGLKEDALISYTFSKFFETGDSTWPLLLPMTKSAVKAMDALSEFTMRDLGWSVDGFVVFGGSKRGWTTWLSAAVDKRIKAIAPIAYDNLALTEQMTLHEKRFGGFSEQIGDYTGRGLQAMLATEPGQLLVRIVDPYAYKERYSLPKLIIRGSNDPYWPVDAMQLYFHDLPGDTWLHIDPNASHGLANYERMLATLGGFYLHVIGALPLPLKPIHSNLTEHDTTATLTVESPLPATTINLWYAFDSTTDFRRASWSPQVAGPGLSQTFSITRPTLGYKAVYGEVVYRIGDTSIIIDTPVYVIGPAK